MNPKMHRKYERKSEPLAPMHVFYKRILGNFFRASFIFIVTLLIGTIGYHWATDPHTPWLDAFHNASMILSGMGPIITDCFTSGGKIFSSFYALFSGIIFVGAMGYILAPGIHRLFHLLHIQDQ
jgi:hypothetical protein